MANIIVECAKYMMILLISFYTYQCFTVFSYEDGAEKRAIFRNQNRLMFMIPNIASNIVPIIFSITISICIPHIPVDFLINSCECQLPLSSHIPLL